MYQMWLQFFFYILLDGKNQEFWHVKNTQSTSLFLNVFQNIMFTENKHLNCIDYIASVLASADICVQQGLRLFIIYESCFHFIAIIILPKQHSQWLWDKAPVLTWSSTKTASMSTAVEWCVGQLTHQPQQGNDVPQTSESLPSSDASHPSLGPILVAGFTWL